MFSTHPRSEEEAAVGIDTVQLQRCGSVIYENRPGEDQEVHFATSRLRALKQRRIVQLFFEISVVKALP